MVSSAISMRPLEVGIIGHRLKSASGKFGDVQFLAALEVEPLHQFARQQQAVGIADLLDFDFHGSNFLGVDGPLYNCITSIRLPFNRCFTVAVPAKHVSAFSRQASPEVFKD